VFGAAGFELIPRGRAKSQAGTRAVTSVRRVLMMLAVRGGPRVDTSRELASPLPDLLFTIAEEDADDETTNREEDVWAGLLRDGADVARRLTERIAVDRTVARGEIDAEDWAALGDAFGIIVRRDTRRHTVTARAFADEADLLAEWEATKAELVTTTAVEAFEMGDSTEGPSSGPLPPRDDQ